ncbi:hypothetical protein FRX31_035193 [Thalictrum thalictroides]|uniref:Uncharacterized protein n=1 Tax=Thalictrum thalictroides TaxID=46969 RepID=A0A7J6USG6_THATH|nr:hypothetical protein FRX31_035193 [Thalictrum thalictroides]
MESKGVVVVQGASMATLIATLLVLVISFSLPFETSADSSTPIPSSKKYIPYYKRPPSPRGLPYYQRPSPRGSPYYKRPCFKIYNCRESPPELYTSPSPEYKPPYYKPPSPTKYKFPPKYKYPPKYKSPPSK